MLQVPTTFYPPTDLLGVRPEAQDPRRGGLVIDTGLISHDLDPTHVVLRAD